MTLLYEFRDMPQEKALVGAMLMAYGEIEFGCVSILSFIYGTDGDRAARVLFRARGESPRLEVADAVIRPELSKFKLEGKWDNAYGAAKHCKNIRNQYAHCHWQNSDAPEAKLCFIDLDAISSGRVGTLEIFLEPIDLTLLEAQHRYFEYTTDLLYWLAGEYQVRAGQLASHNFANPKSVPQPPSSNRKALLEKLSGTEKT